MDLLEKAAWHEQLNGGSVPLLETQDGEFITDSAIISQVAIEANEGKGLDVVPKDPILAAKMRMQIEECSKWMSPIFQVYGSRGLDATKNANLKPTIENFNNLIKKANGKFLLGTDEPTLLDCWFVPFLETFTDWHSPCVMQNVLTDCDYD
jgi:glutathione S-transferase